MKGSLGTNFFFPDITCWSFSYMFVHDLMCDKVLVFLRKIPNRRMKTVEKNRKSENTKKYFNQLSGAP